MMAVAWLLLLLQIGNPPIAPTAETGSIEGTVLRRGNREPLGEVHVLLISTGPSSTLTNGTDDAGRFSFKNVKAGTYRLGFFANGYARQEYGQRTFPGTGSVVKLDSGQAMKAIVVELTPTGSVSGMIRDKDERPLAGVPVQLMRAAFDGEGYRTLQPSGIGGRTDDRGYYRIYFVTPGRYYLNAGTVHGGYPCLQSTGPNAFCETYTSVFYPGTTDLKFASTIDVAPDVDLRGMDFTVSRIQGVHIRGRVIDSMTGQPPEKLQVWSQYRDPTTGVKYDLERIGGSKVISQNGNFEFRNVLPGLFTVSASGGDSGARRVSTVPIEVAGSDIEGIVVTISSGASIAGRLRVDGQVRLESHDERDDPRALVGLSPLANTGIPAPTNGKRNPDGTFRIDAVLPGEYRFWVRTESKLYIKDAHLGPIDLLKAPLQFTGRETGSIDVVLSPNLASLQGTVIDNRLAGAQGAQVVLVPDQSRHRPELFNVGRTDQNGEFLIPDIAPGDYKAYAWESIEPNGWFDLDLAKKYEQYATPIHLSESSHQTVAVRLIPAAPR